MTTMATVPITIEVDEEAAKVYVEASPEDRRKIELWLSLRLREYANSGRKSLEEVMDELGAEAEANGLTPEILESILRGHDD